MKLGWMEKVVATIILSALVMGAFPVSFASAEGEEAAPAADVVVDSLVEETEEGDLCDNMLGVQLEIPAGFMADGSACYLIDESEEQEYVIEGHKYECIFDTEANEGDGEWNCDIPVEGWFINAGNDLGDDFSTTTDESGFYRLVVPAGEWLVEEGQSDYWKQIITLQNGEEVDSADCYFDFRGESKEVLTRTTESIPDGTCEFGNVHITSPVIGLKWNDENSNGVQDEGEAGVAGWKITAYEGDGEAARVAETTTNEDGVYILNLEPGDWTISEESRSGWTQVAVEQDFDMVEGSTCEFSLGRKDAQKIARVAEILENPEDEEEYIPTCSFYNHFTPQVEEPETPRRGGGGSGTRLKDRTTPAPQVLGASTTAPSCGMYLTDYMRMGKEASSTEVTKLQIFLNAVGIKIAVTGMFDAATDAAVRKFQGDHKAEVLTPWYLAKLVPHENPTGWVYQLTRWKINNIVCPGSEAYPVLN